MEFITFLTIPPPFLGFIGFPTTHTICNRDKVGIWDSSSYFTNSLIKIVPKDTKVSIIGEVEYSMDESGEFTPWVKIKTNSIKEGWVNQKYLCEKKYF